MQLQKRRDRFHLLFLNKLHETHFTLNRFHVRPASLVPFITILPLVGKKILLFLFFVFFIFF